MITQDDYMLNLFEIENVQIGLNTSLKLFDYGRWPTRWSRPRYYWVKLGLLEFRWWLS